MKRVLHIINIILDVLLIAWAVVNLITKNISWIDFINLLGVPILLCYSIRKLKEH